MAKNQTARSPESKRLIEVKAKNQTARSPENRVIMLEAMKQRGKSLRYATREHETDREFMLEAMKQRGNSLKHAAPEHKFVPGPFISVRSSSFQSLSQATLNPREGHLTGRILYFGPYRRLSSTLGKAPHFVRSIFLGGRQGSSSDDNCLKSCTFLKACQIGSTRPS